MLYLIPTPIGNLEDITLRSVRILKESDLILAEDTRTSQKLLKHYDVFKPLKAYHMHNERKMLPFLIERLKKNEIISLISDAGTPAISDPGFLLIRACIEANLDIQCLPGPTAFLPALVVSGLALHEFVFIGFLPPKKGRKKKLAELAKEKRTLVLYESPHKLLSTLKDIEEHFGARKTVVCREISKKFEQTLRGTPRALHTHFTKTTPKGENVLVIEGCTKQNSRDEQKEPLGAPT